MGIMSRVSWAILIYALLAMLVGGHEHVEDIFLSGEGFSRAEAWAGGWGGGADYCCSAFIRLEAVPLVVLGS